MPRTELLFTAVLTRVFGSWLARARSRPVLNVIQVGIGLLPLANANFEFVSSLYALGPLPEPVLALTELRRALRVAGLFRLKLGTPINHNDGTGFAGKELHS